MANNATAVIKTNPTKHNCEIPGWCVLKSSAIECWSIPWIDVPSIRGHLTTGFELPRIGIADVTTWVLSWTRALLPRAHAGPIKTVALKHFSNPYTLKPKVGTVIENFCFVHHTCEFNNLCPPNLLLWDLKLTELALDNFWHLTAVKRSHKTKIKVASNKN